MPGLPGLTALTVAGWGGERTGGPRVLPPVPAGQHHRVGGLGTAELRLGGVQPAVHTELARPVEAELLHKDALLSQPGQGAGQDLLSDLTPRLPPASQPLLILQPLEADQPGVPAELCEGLL